MTPRLRACRASPGIVPRHRSPSRPASPAPIPSSRRRGPLHPCGTSPRPPSRPAREFPRNREPARKPSRRRRLERATEGKERGETAEHALDHQIWLRKNTLLFSARETPQAALRLRSRGMALALAGEARSRDGRRGAGRPRHLARPRGARARTWPSTTGARGTRPKSAADAIRAMDRRAAVVEGDLARPEDCRRVVRDSIAALGSLDFLVHSAANFHRAPLEETDETLWDSAMDVNVRAGFLLARQAAPTLQERRGRIVLISDFLAESPGAQLLRALRFQGRGRGTRSGARDRARPRRRGQRRRSRDGPAAEGHVRRGGRAPRAPPAREADRRRRRRRGHGGVSLRGSGVPDRSGHPRRRRPFDRVSSSLSSRGPRGPRDLLIVSPRFDREILRFAQDDNGG